MVSDQVALPAVSEQSNEEMEAVLAEAVAVPTPPGQVADGSPLPDGAFGSDYFKDEIDAEAYAHPSEFMDAYAGSNGTIK